MSTQAAPGYPAAGQPRSSATVLIFALIMGAATAVLSVVHYYRIRSEVAARVITIYKLAKDVQPGYRIKPNTDLFPVKLPDTLKDSLPFSPVTPETLSSQVREPLTRAARQGEVLAYDMWVSQSEALDYKIAPGRRGVPLPINSRAASGIIRPGMLVDIAATFVDPQKKEPSTYMVIEAVKVVAVGGMTEEQAKGRTPTYSTITVELDPSDAEAMIVISKHVSRDGFDVIIRNRQDDDARFLKVNPAVKALVGVP